VSVEAARRDYGVVITGTGADLSIDEAATRSLRAALAAGPGSRDVNTQSTADRGHRDANAQMTAHRAPGDADAPSTADRSRVAPISGHPRYEPGSWHSQP
jgi:ribose 5-phosphate isomerase RpiB